MKNRRTTYLLAVAIALALATVGYVTWQPNTVSSGPQDVHADETAPEEGLAEPELSDTPLTDLGGAEFMDPPPPGNRDNPIGKTEATRIQQLVATQEPFPHDVLMDDYKRELWADIENSPPPLLQRGDPAVDAEMAYRLYMFYGNCSVTPRTDEAIARRIERTMRRAQNASEQQLDHLENSANQLLDYYELCLMIPPEVDCRMEAVNWMTEAVNLGHEIAQVQFYEKAMGFLLRPDRWSGTPPLVMLESGLIEQFKATARYALKSASEKGHPEAFMAMADAADDGIIYPQDRVLAYAYLRVAEMRAAQAQRILDRVGRTKSDLAGKLDQAQIAEAEQLAIELNSEIGATGG